MRDLPGSKRKPDTSLQDLVGDVEAFSSEGKNENEAGAMSG
jgi:hypothetical protein